MWFVDVSFAHVGECQIHVKYSVMQSLIRIPCLETTSRHFLKASPCLVTFLKALPCHGLETNALALILDECLGPRHLPGGICKIDALPSACLELVEK